MSLRTSILVAGFSAILVQLVFLRELLNVFEGNEAVLGIVLGNWMLLMGAGAWLGKHIRTQKPVSLFILAQILQAVLPLATIFLLRTGRHLVWVRGASLGMSETILGCFVILLPFCVTAGLFLVLATQCISELWEETKEGRKRKIKNGKSEVSFRQKSFSQRTQGV